LSRWPASVPMAAVMTMAPVVTMSRSPPAIARVGVSAPVVLAIGVRIELGAPARIGNDVLRRSRTGKCGQECQGNRAKQYHWSRHRSLACFLSVTSTAMDRKRSCRYPLTLGGLVRLCVAQSV
jgi:hypothetical protein